MCSDKSGVSINGVPVILYTPENVDFTNEIIETLKQTRSRYSFDQEACGSGLRHPCGSKSNEALRFASNFKDTRGLNSRVFFCTDEISR